VTQRSPPLENTYPRAGRVALFLSPHAGEKAKEGLRLTVFVPRCFGFLWRGRKARPSSFFRKTRAAPECAHLPQAWEEPANVALP